MYTLLPAALGLALCATLGLAFAATLALAFFCFSMLFASSAAAFVISWVLYFSI